MEKRPKKLPGTAIGNSRKFPVTGSLKIAEDVTMAEDAIHSDYHRTSVADWLAMSSAVSRSIISEFDLIKLGTAGVTKNAIHNLASSIGISRKDIAEDIFNISVKTLERKGMKAKLDKKTSSHAVEIAKLLQHAYDVFRDKDKLKRWLNTENRALNNLKPVELFDTLSGLVLVNDVLVRIEEGVYS
jgi:putative toxin-antitoxin system antitoxin component (TIGR02293 family)